MEFIEEPSLEVANASLELKDISGVEEASLDEAGRDPEVSRVDVALEPPPKKSDVSLKLEETPIADCVNDDEVSKERLAEEVIDAELSDKVISKDSVAELEGDKTTSVEKLGSVGAVEDVLVAIRAAATLADASLASDSAVLDDVTRAGVAEVEGSLGKLNVTALVSVTTWLVCAVLPSSLATKLYLATVNPIACCCASGILT